ncbi:MAG: RNA polymerase sigma factor [Anaerolineae bacterium]|nr:MAG: RNA polymerase sigma factor [Anaerolineae bacterium]
MVQLGLETGNTGKIHLCYRFFCLPTFLMREPRLMIESNATPVNTPQDLPDQVRQAQMGNEDAFATLYDHFYPIVHRRVWHMVPPTDAEDVTQEVFIAMVKSLKSFRGDSKFTTWLNALTNYQVANYYRKREHQVHKMTEDTDLTSEQAGLMDIGQDMRHQEDIIGLRRGLAALPEHYRDVLLLRFVDGLQFDEMAIELGKTLDATKSLFRRALQALQDEVK